MGKEALVNVIVPLYNKESTIGRCLESLKNQSYSNYKVLVIDDGSTDKSYNIAKRYSSEKIQVYKKNNGGVSSARNYGIDLADGEFVAFVDSDDWVDENYISDFFHINDYTSNSLGMQPIEINKGSKKYVIDKYDYVVIKKPDLANGISKYNLLHSGYPFGKLYCLNLLKKYNIRFLEGLPTHEDHIFVWTYMQYIDRIILSSNPNYNYIIDENPKSLSKVLYTPEIFFKASDALLNSINSINSAIPLTREYYCRAKTDFGLTQRIRAILSSYIKGYPKAFRIKILTQEFSGSENLYKDYRSKRLLQDFAILIMRIMPIKFLNLILASTITILGLKGKDVRLFIK